MTSMPASAQSLATLAAWSSEPPASTSARSRQASTWMRRSPAPAARSPSLAIDARRSSIGWSTLDPGGASLGVVARTLGGVQRLASITLAVTGLAAAMALTSAATAPVPPAAAAGCTKPAPSVAGIGAAIDALRGPRWTAADLTSSVDLTDGRRLWLYGDTITSGLNATGGAALVSLHGPELGDRAGPRLLHALAQRFGRVGDLLDPEPGRPVELAW